MSQIQTTQPLKPDGTPWPLVLNAEEACDFLKLPGTKKQQLETLRYYRDRGRIKGFRCGRVINYALKELLRYSEEASAS